MTRGKKLVIAAGGTGGHVFPAVAVAERAQEQGWQVRFLGGQGGMEERLVSDLGFPIETLPVGKWKRVSLRDRAVAAARLPEAVARATSLLRRERPDVVVGAGGYVAGPVALAASMLRVPMVLLEQNAVPGAANRTLSRFASAVAVTFQESVNWFSGKARVQVCGNPVRRALVERFGDPEPRVHSEGPLHLGVLGGSQGARALNDTMTKAAPALFGMDLEIWHQTGPHDEPWVQAAYEKFGLRAKTQAFVQDMPAFYEWADLVLCRAGATTLAELWVAGRPAILVPFPYAADDHQTANARVAAQAGAARLVPQRELTTVRLLEELRELIQNRRELSAMARAARGLARPQAAQCVLELCEQLSGRGG